MAFLDHLRACNAHDLGNFLPFRVAGQTVGWLRRPFAARLCGLGNSFAARNDAIHLADHLITPDQRSQAVADACRSLGGDIPTPRGELYAVKTDWGQPTLLSIDRAWASLFGIRAFGVHVNGLVATSQGLGIWVAKRADDRQVAPGQLDNIIAGGQPAHLTLADNLIKEAAEEADVPAHLAAQARPVGAISYCMEDEWGLKPDTMFCFDLILPPDFTPRNTDGEIQSFALMSLAQVVDRVRETQDFKFNVNLVIIDLLIRLGVLTPDGEPDYTRIVQGLRAQLPR